MNKAKLLTRYSRILFHKHWRLNSKERSDIFLAEDVVNRKKWRKTWRSGRWYLSD